jgi:hypothetical protein
MSRRDRVSKVFNPPKATVHRSAAVAESLNRKTPGPASANGDAETPPYHSGI